jgi:predicted nucleic-acid-binding protein
MNITADTNVLVRAIVADDRKQARAAQSALENSERVAVTAVTLCEFVWVLSRGYGIAHSDIGAAIRRIIASANVKANRSAIEAGLALLEAGGDFADGVISHEGASLGAETFLSFDKDAVKRLKHQGLGASLLS